MSNERSYLEKLVERYERRIERNNKLLESVDNPLLDREKLVERSKHLEEKLELYRNELKKLAQCELILHSRIKFDKKN